MHVLVGYVHWVHQVTGGLQNNEACSKLALEKPWKKSWRHPVYPRGEIYTVVGEESDVQ